MFISKKYLSRRTVLRGLGTSVALPLLDAMVPAATALAQTAANVQPRMGFVFFPHGAVMQRWTPATVGSDFVVPEILAPAAAHKNKMTIVSGLRNKPAEKFEPAPTFILPAGSNLGKTTSELHATLMSVMGLIFFLGANGGLVLSLVQVCSACGIVL